jgi:hypothetical protein
MKFSRVRMSEDKVRTKDPCWSVGTIYDPRELPGVSTAGPGLDECYICAYICEVESGQKVLYRFFS